MLDDGRVGGVVCRRVEAGDPAEGEDLDALVPVLKGLGQRHTGYGVVAARKIHSTPSDTTAAWQCFVW